MHLGTDFSSFRCCKLDPTQYWRTTKKGWLALTAMLQVPGDVASSINDGVPALTPRLPPCTHSPLHGICLVFLLLPGIRQSGELGGCTSELPGITSTVGLLRSNTPLILRQSHAFLFPIFAILPYNYHLLVVAAVLNRSEYLALVLKGSASPRLVLLSPALHHPLSCLHNSGIQTAHSTQPCPRSAAN